MKYFRYFVAAVLFLGLSSAANAFQFTVLDPTGGQGTLPLVTVTGVPIPFSFYQCPPFIDPSQTNTTMGCFGAANGTPITITSFSATITANAPLPAVTCPSGGAFGLSQAFTTEICTVSGNTLTVDFSGGNVAPGSTLWIIQDGVEDTDFAAGAGTFTLDPTPEPSSFLLALSSIGPLGYLVRRRRRAKI